MEYFIFGMLLGYILYPTQKLINKIFSEAYKSTYGCKGNCNQGRSPCDCKKETNGL